MKTKHLRLMQRAYVILFFCFMYLPIAYMLVFSFNQSKGYALFTGFTLKWYTSLFHNSAILSALRVSLEVALISAVIATVLGTAASLGIASMSRKSRLVVTNITYIPVVNPEIITGISLMLLFAGVIAVAALTYLAPLTILLPVIWIYTLFDTINRINMPLQELRLQPDEYMFLSGDTGLQFGRDAGGRFVK